MVWLGSFLVVATTLVIWGRVPLGPLIVGGVLALAGTVLRYFYLQRRSRF